MAVGSEIRTSPRITWQAGNWALGALVVLAIVLRLVPTWFLPSIEHADEIFQATEQAHRLVYGSGLVPWEFRLGARSWLLPGVIAGLMQCARLLGDGPDYYLPVIYLAFAALGAVPVVCSFLWCRRFFGLAGAIIGGTVVAVAPELVYFGARTLTEVVAAHVLVLALYVLEPGFCVTGRRRLVAGGALLGLTFVLRFHLAPALALAALWTVLPAPRRRLPAIAAGGLAVVALAAVLDAATLGAPLASISRNFLYNIGYGVSSEMGIERRLYYVIFLHRIWEDKLFILGLLALVGAWRLPLLLAVAGAIVLAHSAIQHKELRFIFPAIELFAVLAGVGLAKSAAWVAAWMQRGIGSAAIAQSLAAGVAIVCWCAIVFDVWSNPLFAHYRRYTRPNLLAASFVARLPGVCGIGLYNDRTWGPSGGYTYFHRPLPLYWFDTESELVAGTGFNILVYTKPVPEVLGFQPLSCFGNVCVGRRPDGCVPTPITPLPLPKALVGVVANP